MLSYRSIVAVFLGFMLCVGFVNAADMDTSIVIVTPVPQPKEVVVEPTGYTECKTVAARWHNGHWHAAYKACRYSPGNPSYQGEGWVAGHWSCSKYKMVNDKAECTNWDWISGRWVKKYEEVEIVE